jgi:hypothetical protein
VTRKKRDIELLSLSRWQVPRRRGGVECRVEWPLWCHAHVRSFFIRESCVRYMSHVSDIWVMSPMYEEGSNAALKDRYGVTLTSGLSLYVNHANRSPPPSPPPLSYTCDNHDEGVTLISGLSVYTHMMCVCLYTHIYTIVRMTILTVKIYTYTHTW